MSRHHAFTLTVNNYTDVDVDRLREYFDNHCDYMIIGKEVCPSTGTPHLQCYFHMKEGKTFSAVLRHMDCNHLEVAKGTADDNFVYCSKDKDFCEWGTRPKNAIKQCRLNNDDYAACIEFAKANDMKSIEDNYPKLYVVHYSTFNRIVMDNMKSPQPLDDVCGEWWWGPPGTGKSHKAFHMGCYDKEPNKWFGGYHDPDPIVIQDLDHDNAKWMGYHLKKWADKYPFTAETKGKQVSIRPVKVIVTSNYTIRQLFTDEQLCLALERRFKVTHFSDFFVANQNQC